MTAEPYANANGLPLLFPRKVAEAMAKSGQAVGDWINTANGFRCPLGAEPGRAWILAPRRTAEQLKDSSEITLTLGSGTQQVRFPTLRYVRADRLTPGLSNHNDAPYIVELADVRHLLRMSFVNKAYNVRPVSDPEGDYFDGTMNGASAWTWATLFADLWDNLPAGLAGAAPSLPITPEGTPERLKFNAVSAWDAIDQLLAKIGCTIKYDPIGDAFTVIEVGASDASISELGTKWRKDLTLDSESFEGGRAKYPATLKICFPAVHPGAGEEDLTETPYFVVDYTASDYSTDTGTTLDVATGTMRAIFDPMEATYDGGANPTNETALDDRAAERGQQYYRTLEQSGGGRRRATYRGLISEWLPGKQIQEVWWRLLATGPETVILRYARGESQRIDAERPIPVSVRYGKVAPAAGFSQGALTAPDNEVTEWTGIDGGTPSATSKAIACHWSTGAFSQGDEVAVTTFSDGSKVVSCFPGGF